MGYILQHKHRWNQSTEKCALGGRAPVLSQRKGEYQERAHCNSRYRITHPLESRGKVRHKQGCVREAPAEHLSPHFSTSLKSLLNEPVPTIPPGCLSKRKEEVLNETER